uniref:Uncharacterized protein n=1 Tax=Helianthus annuus TaxID=4232 RepID=A0A251V730_HELAN
MVLESSSQSFPTPSNVLQMLKEDANSGKVSSDVPAALKELNENVDDFTLADSSGYKGG